MKSELLLRVLLQSPPADVDYGIQKGSGNNYETFARQRSVGSDLEFSFHVNLKTADPLSPDFSGPFVHGPRNERFVYIDIGKTAGQVLSPWSRRLKIPLRDISIKFPALLQDPSKAMMITTVAGTGKDGGPNCGTVKPFNGWQLVAK